MSKKTTRAEMRMCGIVLRHTIVRSVPRWMPIYVAASA